MKMKGKLIAGVALAALACAGAAPKAPANAAGDPKEVIATVGKAKLTRGELDADVAKFIEARKAQIPPAQLEQAKNYLTQQFKQQFITKTLLLKEAAKKGVAITDADITARANDIIKANKGRPNAPATLDELLARHPLGAERARAEFRDSVLINKLVDQELSLETGRVEKGSRSNQEFEYCDIDFEYYSFKTESIHILPNSRKQILHRPNLLITA